METGLCGDCFGGTLPEERKDIVCTCPNRECPNRECPKCGERDQRELITINVAGQDKTKCKSCIRELL